MLAFGQRDVAAGMHFDKTLPYSSDCEAVGDAWDDAKGTGPGSGQHGYAAMTETAPAKR